MSVGSVRAPNSNTERSRTPRIGVNVAQGRSIQCAIFSLEGQTSKVKVTHRTSEKRISWMFTYGQRVGLQHTRCGAVWACTPVCGGHWMAACMSAHGVATSLLGCNPVCTMTSWCRVEKLANSTMDILLKRLRKSFGINDIAVQSFQSCWGGHSIVRLGDAKSTVIALQGIF